MKKIATLSSLFAILFVLVFGCTKNNPVPTTEMPEVRNPAEDFVGNYVFKDTCELTQWNEPVVVQTGTINMPQDTINVLIGFTDTLIVTSLEYTVAITKDEGNFGHIFISNFQNTGKEITAIVGEDGNLQILDAGAFNLLKLHGIGLLSGNHLELQFAKQDEFGLQENCWIIGKKQ